MWEKVHPDGRGASKVPEGNSVTVLLLGGNSIEASHSPTRLVRAPDLVADHERLRRVSAGTDSPVSSLSRAGGGHRDDAPARPRSAPGTGCDPAAAGGAGRQRGSGSGATDRSQVHA